MSKQNIVYPGLLMTSYATRARECLPESAYDVIQDRNHLQFKEKEKKLGFKKNNEKRNLGYRKKSDKFGLHTPYAGFAPYTTSFTPNLKNSRAQEI